MSGKVKWFSSEKGYGFIAPDGGGADVFVHHTGINAKGFRKLEQDQVVDFDLEQDPKKGPKAVNVQVVQVG